MFLLHSPLPCASLHSSLSALKRSPQPPFRQCKGKIIMANSKYAYVKSFEPEDRIGFPNIIVLRVEGHNFERILKLHEISRPYEEKCLNLMNSCAVSVMNEYQDVAFSYGFNDEYSKVLSVVTSFFTSVYVEKWKEFFGNKVLKCPPIFKGRVIVCATIDALQQYLLWRQRDCYVKNLYDICLWKLVDSGKSEKESHEILKGTQKKYKNELLYSQFDTNYNNIDKKFRWGSCVFMTKVESVIKHDDFGSSIRRTRRVAKVVQSENIAGRMFWNDNSELALTEIGAFVEDVVKIDQDYLLSFQIESKLMQSVWIVVRVDGCHFHKFSRAHGFEKPNDDLALKLMNSCAAAILGEFPDVIFAYGHSDEYSFVLRKDSEFCGRKVSDVVSTLVSHFTAEYVMNWVKFFPRKTLLYSPTFDGRAVCYPSCKILIDYLSWRQVDCHINNQYNTCFWMLVKSGHTKSEAQSILKGTQTLHKLELLQSRFGLEYEEMEGMFRFGSSVFREEKDGVEGTLVIQHCDIIGSSTFWEAHPNILHH